MGCVPLELETKQVAAISERFSDCLDLDRLRTLCIQYLS